MIRAILFDKDGTLLDFERTWLPVALQVVDQLMADHQVKGEEIRRQMLLSIGVTDTRILADGFLAQGTNRSIAQALYRVLESHGAMVSREEFVERSTDLFNRIAAAGRIYPTEEGLERLLEDLKNRGFLIGLATADTEHSAHNCLSALGIDAYFDFVGADNGEINPKPHPEMMESFCRQYRLKPREVVMVGDTPTDMKFGHGAGAGFLVGVLCGTGTAGDLSPWADVLVDKVSDIVDTDGKLIWDR